LNRNGRRLIGWDEIIEGGLAPNATVMSWRGSQGGIDAAKSGHNVIMTPNTFCYFDYYQSKDQENEPPAIGGFIPLEKAYQFDPTEGVPIDKEAFILGGQGNIWTEYMPTSVQVEYMTYPRASALAEALWYGRGNDYNDFLVRLAYLLRRLNSLEVNYRRLDHISESNQGD
jgi:hexosaminidase